MIFYKQIISICTGVVLLSLCACTYEQIEDLVPEDLSFEAHVEPLFDNKCASCHYTSGRTEPDLSTGHSYEALVSGAYVVPYDADNSTVVSKIESGHPATNPMSYGETAIVRQWINDGAIEN